MLDKRWKERPLATIPGKIDHAGPPLDFSFLKLQDVQSLRKERPRAGTRKPIEKDEDEEDAKKGDNVAALNGDDKMDGDKPKEHKESMVIRNTSIPQVNNILANHSVSLTATKNGMMGSRKPEDGKEESQRKKEIAYYVNSLLLNKNELRSIMGLYDVLSKYVLYEPDRLQWLNLSYNYLTKIDKEILNFHQLKNLQLQGNYIADLEEVRKLSNLAELQALTLNGNALEEIKGYRLYVLGLMYSKYETLKRLDTVVISKKEFDSVLVWNERLFFGMQKKLKRLRPSNPKKPPAKEEDEN
mmetsp:Transcript_29847/g.45574  ORF Transcript_29847/g.45574 Transcript_29847/m.45574 type:complete len:299 (+) Transcript_29847:94-990(+)